MSILLLIVIGLVVGVTTVLFGFGGGFVTVPVITVVDISLGGDAVRAATATSSLIMLVNALVATAATRRDVLQRLSGRSLLFVLLASGGAIGAGVARFAPDLFLRWGFVAYIGLTIVDLCVRPGFFRPMLATPPLRSERRPSSGLASWLGFPVGGIAAFLGVGGSVMTVPMMRRSGLSMPMAVALANPLTLAIVAPALAVALFTRGQMAPAPGFVGSVDITSAFALLAGSIPVVIVLRRRPPRISEAVHSWIYVALLAAAAGTVAIAG